MRDRNDWDETHVSAKRAVRDARPEAMRGMPKSRVRAAVAMLPLPMATLSLTVVLAMLAIGPARAQDAPAAPAPAPQAATAAAPDMSALAMAPRGRIKIRVYDAVTKDLLNEASIFIDDPTQNEVRSIPYVVGDATRHNEGGQPLGGVGFVITDPLAAHQWSIVALKEGYQTGRAIVTVLPNQDVEVHIYLRLRERIQPFILLSTKDTTNSTKRSLEFVRDIPVGIGNTQEINSILSSVPGFVRDSLDQVHPRGQRFGVATYIDGFLMPDMPTGDLEGFIPQNVIDSYDVKEGGLSPEFGGDVGVAAMLTTRSVGKTPIAEGTLTTGSNNTDVVDITVGERFPLKNKKLVARAARDQAALNLAEFGPVRPGATVPAPGSVYDNGPSVAYLLHISQRNTSVAAESPQNTQYQSNNEGLNQIIFGKIDYDPSVLLHISGILDINGAKTGIADRTRDGGVGFLGKPDPSETPAQQIATEAVTPSQDELGQSQFQKENNKFSMVQVQRLLKPRDILSNPDSTLTVSIGGMDNFLRLQNDNDNFDPRDLTNPSSPLYTNNSSLEFNPTISRKYEQVQSQLDYVFSRLTHVIKAGVSSNGYSSDEQYQFIPGSQVALDALFARSPLLVPAGVYPTGALDGYGNPIVHYPTGLPASAPLGEIRRDGSYNAAYLQDTWSISNAMTINSGLRLDNYTQSAVPANVAFSLPGQKATDSTEVSPRLNMVVILPSRGPLGFLGGTGLHKGVFRASYDHLFQRPPLGQGTYFDISPIKPQTADQWEMGLEKQFGKDKTFKITTYSTEFKNFLDVTGLFPGAQFGTGALVLVNYPRAVSEGWEFSYNYNPTFRGANPLSMYATWTNGSVKLLDVGSSFDSMGDLVTAQRASFDQLNTINLGVSYKLRHGASIGMDSYLGSGLYGSIQPGSNKPDPIGILNLKLATSPKMFRKSFGFDLSVENVGDNKDRFNYYTGYEGLRYQIGRTILTSVYARF